MAKARQIVKRRKAVTNTRKITKTMQLIATARFQQAYNRSTAGKPYARKMTEMVGRLTAASGQIDDPLLRENPDAPADYLLVLTSNRGFCGAYNASVLNKAMDHLRAADVARPPPDVARPPSAGPSPSPSKGEGRGEGDAHGSPRAAARVTELHCVGKKGVAYFKFLRRKLESAVTTIGDKPRFDQVEPIADAMMNGFRAGKYRRIYVAYMRFISTGRQRAEVLQLLPIEALSDAASDPTSVGASGGAAGSGKSAAGAGSDAAAAAAPGGERQYDFSPAPRELLAALLPQMIKVRLYQCFTDAVVSEQVARMVAMKSATDAAGDMIKDLTRRYNRARQSQITLELLDIVGGAEALK